MLVPLCARPAPGTTKDKPMYVVDARLLADKLDGIRGMLGEGAKNIPAALEQLDLLSYALTHPAAPAFGHFEPGMKADTTINDIGRLWQGDTPRPNLQAVR